MPYAPGEGIRLYYEVAGEGPPLLLLSGVNGGVWTWYAQVPQFSRRYRTITFDNRGGGRSDLTPGPYTAARLARDALALLDHLEMGPVLVAGISLGGMIAQELALAAPSRVRGLVLAATHPGGPDRTPPPPEVLAVLSANAGLSVEEILRKDLPLFFSPAFLEGCHEAVAAYLEVHRQVPLQSEAALAAQLAAARSFDAVGRLAGLRIPTLVLTGGADRIVPPANAGLLGRLIPRSRLGIFLGAGHALQVECAAPFNAAVTAFFQGLA